jgi:hypothetical protein
MKLPFSVSKNQADSQNMALVLKISEVITVVQVFYPGNSTKKSPS